MLILKPEDVQYCYVSHLRTTEAEALLGFNYHGHLFIKVASYAQDQLQNAIQRCREFLELRSPILSIIIKEPTGVTLWSEDNSVQIISHEKKAVALQAQTLERIPKSTVIYRGVEIVRETTDSAVQHQEEKPKLNYRSSKFFR